MPLNRTNNTVFGTVIQYATTGQIDPLQRWYGLNNHSLTINQYGWINGTGTFGVSTGGVTPQFDVNGAFTTGYIAALAELTAGTLKIGTSSNTENYIAFRGTTGDLPGNFDHGFIGERLYGGTESSELLLFKGNDIEGISGPDRIRLLAANHVFDTYTVGLSGSFSTVGGTTSNVYTRMIIKKNGNIGIGTTSPDTIGSSSVPAMLGIVSNAVGTVGLVVRGVASQTANLQEWQNSSGTTLTSITANGVLAIGNFELNSTFGATFYNKQAAFYDTSNTATYVSAISFARGNTGGAWMALGTTGDTLNGVASVDIRDGNNAQLFSIGYTANAKINLQSASSVGLIIKSAASQTADLQQWQNSSGTVLANIDSTGRFLSTRPIRTDDVITSGSQATTLGQISAIASSSSRIGLVVRGAVSQAANLQEWQDSSGTVLASVTKDGDIVSGGIVSTGMTSGNAGVDNVLTNLGIQASSWGLAYFRVKSGSAGSVVSMIDGAVSQTGDLTQWRNDLGSVMAKVTSNGVFVSGSSSGSTSGIQVGSASFSGVTWNGISNPAGVTTLPSLVVKGITSQTANLQEWQNSAGTVLAKITAAGAIDVTAITVNGSPISTSSIPAAADVELMSIMGAY